MTDFLTDDEVAMKLAGDHAPELFGHMIVAGMVGCRSFPDPADGRPSDDDIRGRMSHILFYLDRTDTLEWPDDALALCDAIRVAATMENPDLDEDILMCAIQCKWPANLRKPSATELN